ncbi:putative signal transducing protein [Carboxylicivirga taeanensis]|uniref:putative signal transducing protein n=1 Tax=Carboxylicivirga taeanensis TaxID=1416875 RepID=UPI003F6E3C20
MTVNNESKLVTVFNGTPMEVEILCQVLKDNGIEASMKNQLIGMIAPHQTLDGADVLVMEKDKAAALKWVEEFKNAK